MLEFFPIIEPGEVACLISIAVAYHGSSELILRFKRLELQFTYLRSSQASILMSQFPNIHTNVKIIDNFLVAAKVK